jgi:pimeloyl-ACP methyl ester carboxylesterase
MALLARARQSARKAGNRRALRSLACVMMLHHVRRGAGRPLLLIHGLGSSRRAWSLIGLALAQRRETIAIDLPGHGGTPAGEGSASFAGLTRILDEWLEAEGLVGVDMVGSSLGARLVLEMARRGRAGAVVALDPGGFWDGWERQFIYTSLMATRGLLSAMQPAIPAAAHSAAARTALLMQLSARPWALNGTQVEREMKSVVAADGFEPLLRDIAFGPMQEGPAAAASGPVTIGWGRHDRLTLPVQAARAAAAFPGSRLRWFEHSGHFPMFDEPDEAARLILAGTG